MGVVTKKGPPRTQKSNPLVVVAKGESRANRIYKNLKDMKNEKQRVEDELKNKEKSKKVQMMEQLLMQHKLNPAYFKHFEQAYKSEFKVINGMLERMCRREKHARSQEPIVEPPSAEPIHLLNVNMKRIFVSQFKSNVTNQMFRASS